MLSSAGCDLDAHVPVLPVDKQPHRVFAERVVDHVIVASILCILISRM
jgi:hypothetical protein